MFGWDWVELEHVLAHNLPKEIVIIMYVQTEVHGDFN